MNLENYLHLVKHKYVLTFIVIFGGDGKDGVLNIFIFVDFRFIKSFVKVRGIVILICDANTDELGYWKKQNSFSYVIIIQLFAIFKWFVIKRIIVKIILYILLLIPELKKNEEIKSWFTLKQLCYTSIREMNF